MDLSPYTPPLSPPGPLSKPPAASGRPKAIRFFGVLNLIFASISLLYVLIVAFNLLRLILVYGADQSPQPLWMIAPLIAIVTAVSALMINAGLKLIRCRPEALQASRRYATASICGNVILVPLMAIPNMGVKHLSEMNPGDISAMIFAFLILIPLSSTYPILCLILLNRRKVKTWFTENIA